MKRFAPVAAAVALAVAAAGSAAAAPKASTLCVAKGPTCFRTLAAALTAAHDGDKVRIGPGAYAGGVTIDASIELVGAGAGKTIVTGGGPVLTIGVYGASSEPTVSIDGVTITGGVTRSSPESVPLTGEDGVDALGGGIEIPSNADFTGGATVTITNSVITGNRVAPTVTVPSTHAVCPSGPCPKALAAGGGIDSWGTLTLDGTTISNNRVGAAAGLSNVASDADGGAIYNEASAGPLTISNSVISSNQVSASAPNGRFANSGGIFLVGGTLTMSGSSVTNNSATLNAAWPNSVDTQAVAGGIEVDGDDSCADPSFCAAATISDSTISGNTVNATNTVGDAVDFCGGICDDGVLDLRDSTLANNRVSATVPTGSPGGASGDSGGFGAGGPVSIRDVQITGNSVSASAPAGGVSASTGGGDTGNSGVTSTIVDSVISNNQITGTSGTGTVTLIGAGFANFGGEVTLRNTTITRNAGTASASTGTANGGGIWNDTTGGGPSSLTLTDSAITHNALTGGAGITIEGGGLFTTGPITLQDSVITHNAPDQCVGC